MRFRTKIFLGWVALTLGLWGGTFFAVRHSVQVSFHRMAETTFAGINRGLHHLYVQRASSMRQACQLVVNIPELRALIAEQNYDLAPENLSSLRERLDYVSGVVDATFVCALNERGLPVAQNAKSPWTSLTELDEFLQHSPAARSLVHTTFDSSSGGRYGLWAYLGKLYQVAAVPLVFQSDADTTQVHPEGALVMGQQLTDEVAAELGKSHGCDITFLADGRIATSSLSPLLQDELIAQLARGDCPSVLNLRNNLYRAAAEPLLDSSSGLPVGMVIVQQDQAHAADFLWEVSRNLVLMMLCGIVAAGCASFLMSLAITRPVNALLTGVQGVALGDLDVEFKVSGRDELAQLAGAFNNMVAQLRQSALTNAQVHGQLSQAYEDLRTNQQQIVQTERLRALGQMASGIAHDFNNHLTGVLAFLEIALDREDLDQELRSWLEMSRESSLAAADVVKLLRNFYRRDTNDALEPVDLNKLATVTISLTRPRWFDMPREHGLVIRVNEDFANVGCVLGNAAELRDALTNLLFNAVDAMPQGGQITVRTRRAGAEVVLEVEDTGTGMTDEVRQRCLEPFFSTKGLQGTGLGLSMVHGIVERNRGRLAIESQVGRGTTVRAFLTRTDENNAAISPRSATGGSERKRILCIDDDLRILHAMAGMLRQLGHHVITTASGADAISRVAAEQFDLLITDLGMPNVDGREVARSAKRLSPHTPVLMLTGWADRLAVEGSLPEGVDQVLAKPITKERLQQAIVAATAPGAVARASERALGMTPVAS